MKLRFDENLSPKRVTLLAEHFPGSVHVTEIGLAKPPDPIVWHSASKPGLVIVSKDEDFHHLSFLRGAPPKVIGINLGNCSTGKICDLLRRRSDQIKVFAADTAAAFLPLP